MVWTGGRSRIAVGVAILGCLAIPGGLLAAPVAAAPAGTVITTVAGNGEAVNNSDGRPAAEAGIEAPASIALAPDGTLYLVTGQQIRAIDPKGTIRTVAGSGKTGFSGDGGAATKASFSSVASSKLFGISGIAVGPDGTLYIADSGNHRIRAVDPDTHMITTVAGSGPTGFDGGAFSGDGGPADRARLKFPKDVTVGAGGTLFIADTENYRIRAVEPKHHTIRTIAGTANPGDGGSQFFPAPDTAGTTATDTFVEPDSVAVGPDGTVYFSESDDLRIRAVDPVHDKLSTILGEGGRAGLHRLSRPGSITISGDTMYIVDTPRFSDPRGTVVYAAHLGAKPTMTVFAGGGTTKSLGDGGRPTAAQIGGDNADVAVTRDGVAYLSDGAHNRIRSVGPAPATSPPARAAADIASYAGADGSLERPTDVAVASDGTVYVLDAGSSRVLAVDPDDGAITTVAGLDDPYAEHDRDTGSDKATDTALSGPSAIALGGHDTLYIADGRDLHVQAVDLAHGTISVVKGTIGIDVSGLAVDTHGVLYVSDSSDSSDSTAERICAIRPGAQSCSAVNFRLPVGTSLHSPGALAFGPDGTLYISDGGRILARDPKTGRVTTIAGTGEATGSTWADDGGPALSAGSLQVRGMAVGADSTLYLVDGVNQRIRAIDPKSGTLFTVAGSGRPDANSGARLSAGGFSGDGGPATRAKLDQPLAVAVGPNGALFIADSENSRIRVVGDVQVPTSGTGTGWKVLAGVLLALVLVAVALLVLRRYRRTRRPAATADPGTAEPTAAADHAAPGADDAGTTIVDPAAPDATAIDGSGEPGTENVERSGAPDHEAVDGIGAPDGDEADGDTRSDEEPTDAAAVPADTAGAAGEKHGQEPASAPDPSGTEATTTDDPPRKGQR